MFVVVEFKDPVRDVVVEATSIVIEEHAVEGRIVKMACFTGPKVTFFKAVPLGCITRISDPEREVNEA